MTDAQKKAKEDARKEFEANAEEAKKKAIEEAQRREQEKEMPDWYKAEKEANAKNNALIAEFAKSFETIKAENEAFKLEKANAERKNLILTKAKELGVPEYRIKEGFAIADNADEATITEYLTTVANNIKANSLPSNKEAFPMSTTLKKEDIDNVAKGLVI